MSEVSTKKENPFFQGKEKRYPKGLSFRVA